MTQPDRRSHAARSGPVEAGESGTRAHRRRPWSRPAPAMPSRRAGSASASRPRRRRRRGTPPRAAAPRSNIGGRDRTAPAEAQLQLARTAFGRDVDAGWQIGPAPTRAFPRSAVGAAANGRGPGAGASSSRRGASAGSVSAARPGGGLERHRCARPPAAPRPRRRRSVRSAPRVRLSSIDGEPGMRLGAAARITPGRRRRASSAPPSTAAAAAASAPSGVVTAAVARRIDRSARSRATSVGEREGRARRRRPDQHEPARLGSRPRRSRRRQGRRSRGACARQASQRPKRSAMAARTSDRPPVDEGKLAGRPWRMVNVGPRAMIRRAPAVTTW